MFGIGLLLKFPVHDSVGKKLGDGFELRKRRQSLCGRRSVGMVEVSNRKT
jgi:hypothetical protein